MTRNKVYVVFVGLKTGVFAQPWNVVRPYVEDYPKGWCRGYKSLHEAQKAWDEWLQQQVPEASR